MLRTIFSLALIVFGIGHAIRGPFYALLFYLWIAYFRPDSFVWEGFIRHLPLSFWAGAWLLFTSVVTGKAFRIDLRLSLLVVFVLHALASSLASAEPLAIVVWQDFLQSAIICYLLALLVDDVRKLRLVILVIVLSLGFEATKQGWDHVVLGGGSKNYNSIRFLGDENSVAVGMFMLVPLTASLIATESRIWFKRSLIFVMLGVMFRGISTYSRGGFLTLLAVVGAFIVRTRRKFLALTAAGVLGVGLLFLMDDAFWQRIESIAPVDTQVEMLEEVSADEASAIGRLHFWGVAVSMANDHPLLGVGFQSYQDFYPQYDPSQGAYGINRAVHSMWFGLVAELGYLGLAWYLLVVGMGLVTTRRIRRRAKAGDEQAAAILPYATAVETAIVAAMVGGSFVNFQYVEMFWHMIALTIAMNRMLVAKTAVVTAPERQPVAVRSAVVPARLSARSMTR